MISCYFCISRKKRLCNNGTREAGTQYDPDDYEKYGYCYIDAAAVGKHQHENQNSNFETQITNICMTEHTHSPDSKNYQHLLKK